MDKEIAMLLEARRNYELCIAEIDGVLRVLGYEPPGFCKLERFVRESLKNVGRDITKLEPKGNA